MTDRPNPSQAASASPLPTDESCVEINPRLWDCLPLGLVTFDPSLRLIRYNRAAAFLVADHANLAEALTAAKLQTGHSDWNQALHQAMRQHIPQRFERVLYHPGSKSERLLNLQAVPLKNTQSSPAAGALIIEDVTDTASLEKRVHDSERMAAVGKLIARVVHELNNPLDGILRYLNLSARLADTDQTDKIGTYLTRARDGLLRMADILRELVDYSRGSPSSFDETDLNNLVEEAVKMMADKAARANVSIVCTLDDTVPAVAGTSLFQVFCNLIKNAIEAMPDGGTVTISTQHRDDEVRIRFEDTGPGLPEPAQKAFEPFFTTKPPGQGTGLGLAICKDVLDKLNGRIIPGNTPRGAVFDVRIPLARCRNRQPIPACHEKDKREHHNTPAETQAPDATEEKVH
jgi:signal transduction histidine kinase